jgi:hypothetical protein
MSKPQATNEEIDMARYDDKKKVQKAPAREGYETSPPASPEYAETGKPAYDTIEAESRGGACDLRVVVFAGQDPAEASDAPRIAGAKVTLASASFNHPRHTNAQGEACWTDLPPGEYWLEVVSPKGYQPRETKREAVTLSESEEALFWIGLEGEEATLCILAYHDAERCGEPAGQARIKHLRFEVFQGSACIGSGKTGDDGTGSVKLSHTGWVELRLQGQVRTAGAILQPACGDRQRVLIQPGRQSEVQVAYMAGLADLTVEALLSANGAAGEEARPLPGVSLALYAQGSGVPMRTVVTEDWPVVFCDLATGNYTLSITPPTSYQGHAVELVDGAQRMPVVLNAGSPTPLSLRFRRARGRVEGCVRGLGNQEGWEGIRLRLVPAQGGTTLRTSTTARGEFLFEDVPAGHYHLELADAKIPFGKGHWILAEGSPARQTVVVRPGGPVTAPPFLLAPDEHTLTVQVLDPDGKPMSHAAVEVLTEDGRHLHTVSTDEQGMRTIELEQAGNYQVRFQNDGSLLTQVEVNKPVFLAMNARRVGGSSSSFPSSAAGSGEATLDIPYPLLTESVSMAGSPWPSSGAPSSADLGQTVQEALRSVLNWRSAGFNGDAKGFVAALNQSFTLTQTQGHTEFTWTPRSYAAVQSGLGALTGAQASIYTRAKVALDQALPLLEGLYPLNPAADPQNVTAIRAIARSGLTELVNELGIEGGPRVLRTDDLFRQLSGYDNNAKLFDPDPEHVKGQLDQLATTFGLRRSQVNTIDEEQNLTNFLIVVDYVLSLQQSWLTQRSFFTRTRGSAPGSFEPFLGTQLVLVERSLAVIAESVREVYMAMDSVFLGREERQVVELRFPNEPSLFVAELLGWIDQVASNEGPQLIKDGGKQGVISFQSTIDKLAGLANRALLKNQPADAPLPPGYRTARVQNALGELARHLQEASQLVGQIRQAA